MRLITVLFLGLSWNALKAADYLAGIARVDITPAGPVWLSGYASRTKPSEGVLQRIWAKALAIQDRNGQKVVIVTADLLGLPRSLTDIVGAQIEKQYALDRSRLLINCSHTHTGPMIRSPVSALAGLDAAQSAVVNEYSRQLTDQLVSVIAAALSAMKPASLAFGEGSAEFAVNRRLPGANGVRLAPNPDGPVDHAVPVLKVTSTDGRVSAILFGYACHNTTLTGEHYKISGDYAGVAQADLEKNMEGTQAMFLQLCAGDQNPNPRSTEDYVRQPGASLSGEVLRVLEGRLQPVRGHILTALQWKDLPVQSHSREDFEKMLADADPYRARFAAAMLRAYDERRPMRSVPWPVQALRLGDNFVVVALGGEVVVEYGMRIKAAHPKTRIVVAGYSNDVMGYIPTAQMLSEGGYEPVGSTIYYGQAAPFSPGIEKIILDAAGAVIRRVRP